MLAPQECDHRTNSSLFPDTVLGAAVLAAVMRAVPGFIKALDAHGAVPNALMWCNERQLQHPLDSTSRQRRAEKQAGFGCLADADHRGRDALVALPKPLVHIEVPSCRRLERAETSRGVSPAAGF